MSNSKSPKIQLEKSLLSLYNKSVALTVSLFDFASIVLVVLVTGASGFIGSHIVRTLLEQGYSVRGTVRDKDNEVKTKPLRELHANAYTKLELVNANLNDASGWNEAVKGCEFVLHVASPFPAESPANEDEVIRPAVDGTLHVLRACAKVSGVRRVVLTSSIVSVVRGHKFDEAKVFTEEDWTNIEDPGVITYEKSKTLAEKAAWDFVNQLSDDKKFELVVLNPGQVTGPMLTNIEGTSATIVKQLLMRENPMVLKLAFGNVDVRDVANAHVKAMTAKNVVGKRIILMDKVVWLKDMALALKKTFNDQGFCVPTCELPTPMLWFARFFDKQAREYYPQTGVIFKCSNERMRSLLGIEPIPMEKSVVDQANSMIERGLVKRK